MFTKKFEHYPYQIQPEFKYFSEGGISRNYTNSLNKR